MRIIAKALATPIVAGATCLLFSHVAIAAPASPCVVRECQVWIGTQAAPDQPVIQECVDWKVTPYDCSVDVKPNVVIPRDTFMSSPFPIGGPRHRPQPL